MARDCGCSPLRHCSYPPLSSCWARTPSSPTTPPSSPSGSENWHGRVLLRTVAVNWIIFVGVGCVIAVLSERWTRAYAALLFALGLLLWGQGNLWNADYGVLAGQDLDLSAHAWRAPYELTGVGGRAARRARVLSARQPHRAVRLARVSGRSGRRSCVVQRRLRRRPARALD